MPITFPSNPSNADEYTFNGRTYTYNASRGVWLGSRGGSVSAGGGGGAALTVSDTAPTSANEGDLWFHSTLLETYVYYNSQWVLSNPSGGSGGGSGGGTTTYATAAELPLTGNSNGDMAFVEETDKLYLWNDTAWYNIALINTAPTITQGGAGSYALATDGTPTVITLTATDPENVPVTWSYTVTSGSLSNGGGVTATVTQADNVFTVTPTTTEAYAGTFTLTFSATDGANTVTDANTFTLAFFSPIQYSSLTTALISTDGTVGTNANFVDNSTNALTVTPTGGPSLQTYSPYAAQGYSLQLDGNDYITPGFNDNFGTGDFTFECWVKTTVGGIIMGQYDGGSQMECFEILTTTGVMASHTDSGTEGAAGTKDLRDNLWHHLVWERHSGTYYYYADGVLQDSRANTENGTQSSGWYISRHGSANIGHYTGELRDIKFTVGTAVYGGTTPSVPTETTIDGTETFVFATGLPYEKDLSTSGSTRTITNYGDPKYVLGGPYDTETYTPADHGGSVYFDGVDDYLAVPADTDFQFGTGDFTVETWINTDLSDFFSFWQNSPVVGSAGQDRYFMGVATDGSVYFSQHSGSGAGFQTSTGVISANSWAHIAIVRNSGTSYIYVNGVEQVSSAVFSGWDFNLSTVHTIGYVVTPMWGRGHLSDLRVTSGTAVYTADFTPPSAPASSSGSALHITGLGANIIDKSQTTTLTLSGDTTSSIAQTKYASSSIYLDGTGDYFDIIEDDSFNFGTGDFTIEFWMWPAAIGSENIILESRATHTDTGFLVMLNGGVIKTLTGGAIVTTGTTTPTINSWYHVAVVRDSTSMRVYINGTEESGSAAGNTSNVTNPFGKFRVGTRFDVFNSFNGYIEDLRITKGLARYTTNFTPPAGSLEG